MQIAQKLAGYSLGEADILRRAMGKKKPEEMAKQRSIFVDGSNPVLYLNGKLLPTQKAFILGREVGYRRLGLEERAMTSSWIRVESFAQLLSNFKASYFSGALLMDRRVLAADLSQIFDQEVWDPQSLVASMDRFGATP